MNATQKKVKDTCGKCDGTGVIQAFRHIDKGVCYCCNGSGFVWVSPYETQVNQSVDCDLDARRKAYFSTLTIEQFKSLSAEKKDAIASWVESKYFTDREIFYRFMNNFQPTWLAGR